MLFERVLVYNTLFFLTHRPLIHTRAVPTIGEILRGKKESGRIFVSPLNLYTTQILKCECEHKNWLYILRFVLAQFVSARSKQISFVSTFEQLQTS